MQPNDIWRQRFGDYLWPSLFLLQTKIQAYANREH